MFAIRSLNKLNKDLRNRAERLEKVIRIKEFSARKTKELIDKELQKSKEKMYEEASKKGQRNV